MDNRNKRIKFWVFISLYLVLMLADGLVTYLHTPDLALEANPLVSVWHLGWGSLFIANLLTFILVFALAYYAFIKYQRLIFPANNRREYLSQLFFGRPDKFIWSFYKLPKRWSPFFAMLGFSLLYTVIFIRVVLIWEWLTYIPAYNRIRAMVPYGRLDILLAIIVEMIMLFYWLEKEYRASKAALGDKVVQEDAAEG